MRKRHEQNGHEADEQMDRCELCGRRKKLTKHHLVPRAVHTKKRYVTRMALTLLATILGFKLSGFGARRV